MEGAGSITHGGSVGSIFDDHGISGSLSLSRKLDDLLAIRRSMKSHNRRRETRKNRDSDIRIGKDESNNSRIDTRDNDGNDADATQLLSPPESDRSPKSFLFYGDTAQDSLTQTVSVDGGPTSGETAFMNQSDSTANPSSLLQIPSGQSSMFGNIQNPADAPKEDGTKSKDGIPLTPHRDDPKIGTKFWVAEDECICREGPELSSKESRGRLGRNRIVYCAGHTVTLPNGIIRMPVTTLQATQERMKAPPFWVTYDASSVDPLKKHILVEYGDEMQFFRTFIENRMKVDRDSWYAFYQDIDRNKNGRVSMIEFEAALLSMKYPDESNDPESNNRRKKLLLLLDTDGSGELTFQEFGAVIGIPQDDLKRVSRKVAEEQARCKYKRWNSAEELAMHARIRAYGAATRMTTPSQRHQGRIYGDESVSPRTLYEEIRPRTSPDSSIHQLRWNHRFAGNDPKQTQLPKCFRAYFGSPGKFSQEDLISKQESYYSGLVGNHVQLSPGEELAEFKEFLTDRYGDLDDISTMEQIFNIMDVNKSGDLAIGEFQQALLTMGYPDRTIDQNSQKRRVRVFHCIDINGGGLVDIYEWCRGLHRRIGVGANVEEKMAHREKKWGGKDSKWAKLARGNASRDIRSAPATVVNMTVPGFMGFSPQKQSEGDGNLADGSSPPAGVSPNYDEKSPTAGKGPPAGTSMGRSQSAASSPLLIHKRKQFTQQRPGSIEPPRRYRQRAKDTKLEAAKRLATEKGMPKVLRNCPGLAKQLDDILYSVPHTMFDNELKAHFGEDCFDQSTPRTTEIGWNHFTRRKSTLKFKNMDKKSAAALKYDHQALMDLQEKFLLQPKKKKHNERNCLQETVDYALLCSKSELSGAIAQITSVANFGSKVRRQHKVELDPIWSAGRQCDVEEATMAVMGPSESKQMATINEIISNSTYVGKRGSLSNSGGGIRMSGQRISTGPFVPLASPKFNSEVDAPKIMKP